MSIQSVRRQGIRAFKNNADFFGDNPYPYGTEAHTEWRRGFCAAQGSTSAGRHEIIHTNYENGCYVPAGELV